MKRIWWGILLVLIGLWIWVDKLGLPEVYHFSRNWPVLIILLGVYILWRSIRRRSRRRVRKIDVISDLEQGKISAAEAVEKLKERKGECCHD